MGQNQKSSKFLKVEPGESIVVTLNGPPTEGGGRWPKQDFPVTYKGAAKVFSATQRFADELEPLVGQVVEITKVKKGQKTYFTVEPIGEQPAAKADRPQGAPTPAPTPAPPPRVAPQPAPNTLSPQNGSQPLTPAAAARVFRLCISEAEALLPYGGIPQITYIATKLFDATIMTGGYHGLDTDAPVPAAESLTQPGQEEQPQEQEESEGLKALRKAAGFFSASKELRDRYPILDAQLNAGLPTAPEQQRKLFTSLRDVIRSYKAEQGRQAEANSDLPPEPDEPFYPEEPAPSRNGGSKSGVPGHVVRIAQLAEERGMSREDKIGFISAALARDITSTKELSEEEGIAVIKALRQLPKEKAGAA